MVVKDACQHRVQVISTGERQVGQTRGQVCFQGSAVDGADISRHDVRRPGRRNGDVEVADDAGVVRGDGPVRHGGRLAQDGRQMCVTASPGCVLCYEWAD